MPKSNAFRLQSPVSSSHASAELESILNASSDAIFTKDLEGIIRSWSTGANEMYGYTAEEIIGKPVSILAPPDRVNEAAEIMSYVSASLVFDAETLRVTKTGHSISVVLKVVPVLDEQGKVIKAVSIARNVSALRRVESEVTELRAESTQRAVIMEAASRVALDILSSRGGIEALTHIADAARRLAGARYAAIGVARPDGNGLSEFVTVGLTPQEELIIGPRPVGAGILGMLLHRTEPLRLSSISGHPSSAGFPPNHPRMDSFLGVPIRRGEVVHGSLYITEKIDGTQFTEEDEIAVQALGDYAAVAIHNLHMIARQRALVSGLINAQEEERRAVAYDLHDGLTQYVMAAHMHFEAFRMASHRGNVDKSERELDRGIHYLKESVLESRRLVNGLRSLALDDLGLAGSLEQLLNEEKDRCGWDDVEFVHNIADQRFNKTLETTAYRIVQEGLTNVRKHASAKRVRVMMLFDERPESGDLFTVEVRDWGKGFSPQEKAGDYAHLGLQGMIERANLIGGKYEIRSAHGEGTVIRAIFPVDDKHAKPKPIGDGID